MIILMIGHESALDAASDTRKAMVRVTIGAFAIAALMGIFALLKGGEFSETQGNVLLTTLLIGVVSVAVLCYLTTAGKPYQWVGILGGIIVSIPAVTALLLIWTQIDDSDGISWKVLAVGSTFAASVAQVSLLLSLAARAGSGVRNALYATLVTVAVVAAMIALPILVEEDFGEWYWRVFGVIAILDVLGTVTVAALMKFGSSGASDDVAITIAPALDSRLLDAAQRSGRSKADIVADALDSFLDSM